MKRRVFISYRRDDDGGDAGRLCDRLRKRFGHRRVFFDVDSIRPSEDFPTAIRRAIGSCDALVVVIGRNWVRPPRDPFGPKIDDPDDFVRLEVVTALEHGIPTIPVLVDGAQMPAASQLPPSLESLATRHALEVSRKRWDYDIGLLIEAVEEVTAPRGMPAWVKILLPVAAAATALTGVAWAMNGDPTSTVPTTSAPATTVPTTSAPATTVPATNASDRVARMTKTVGRTLVAAVIPRPSDDPATPQPPNWPVATTAAPTHAPGTAPPPPTTVGRTTVPPTTTPPTTSPPITIFETTTTVTECTIPGHC